jgi:hypothetical protein
MVIVMFPESIEPRHDDDSAMFSKRGNDGARAAVANYDVCCAKLILQRIEP